MSTPEHWAYLRQWGADSRNTVTALLELRARVEALEEAENDRRFEQAKAIIDKPAPGPSSSLVERVATTLRRLQVDSPWIPRYDPEARAAIRVVAAWLRDRGGYPWAWVAQTLEQEADRG